MKKSLTWNIQKWSPKNNYESQVLNLDNTDFRFLIISNHERSVLSFKVNQSQKPEQSLKKIGSIQASIEFNFNGKIKKFKKKIQRATSSEDNIIDIPLTEFSKQYNERSLNIILNAEISEDSARPPSKSGRFINNQKSQRTKTGNEKPPINSLSTKSSPTRHASVANVGNAGRLSKASFSSQSSAAGQPPVINANRSNILNNNKNNPKVIQPNSKGTKIGQSTVMSTRPKYPITRNSNDHITNNNNNNAYKNSKLPQDPSKKPKDSSPSASISASKAQSNSNVSSPSTPITAPRNSSNNSPSATIATKYSLLSGSSKKGGPQITTPSNLTSSSSKVTSQTAKLETESNLPSIHNPRTSRLAKAQQPQPQPQPLTAAPSAPQSAPVPHQTTAVVLSPHPPITTAKKDLSFAGLSNQGATCYMNSVLQSLFHIPLFRRSVFELPTEDEADKAKSIALNLQALFCNLLLAPQQAAAEEEMEKKKKKEEHGEKEGENADKDKPIIDYSRAYRSTYVKPVSTKNLTKSFGWDSSQVFQQQDIQEFFRVLLNKLDDKIDEKNKKNKESKENANANAKKNEGENKKEKEKEDEEGVKHVSDIFKGQTIFTISGEKVDYKSERYEDFYDISLSVKGCETLENSFKQFTRKEQLSDSYDTGIEGQPKIAVQIQAQIFKLPKVLTLHLQRFEYDFVHDALTKIYDELKFPKSLDTEPFLHDLSPFKKGEISSKFTLTGVLIHSGDASFGHYYVYLRPRLVFNEDGSLNEEDSSFYEFNDSSVRKVKDDEAITDNFGGYYNYNTTTTTSTDIANNNNGNADADDGVTSPYLSSFKRHSAYMLIYSRNDCLREIYDTDFAAPKYIQEYAKSCQKSAKSAKKTVTFFDENSIRLNTEEGKLGVYNDKMVFTLKLSTNLSNEQLYNEVARYQDLSDISFIRLWSLNYLNEIDRPIPCNSKLLTVLPKTVFIQYKPQTEPTEVAKDQILLILKIYTQNPETPLLYASSILFSRSSKIKELKKKIGDILQLPNEAEIRLFEEVTYSSYTKQLLDELTDDESTLFMANKYIKSGSSIIIQSNYSIPDEVFESIYYTFKNQDRTEDDRTNSEIIYNYTDYMVSELPENVTDYIEMKRNVQKLQVFDYNLCSNSHFLERNENDDDEYIDQNSPKYYGTFEFPYSIDLDQLIEFIEQMRPYPFDKERFRLALFRHSNRLEGPSAFPMTSINDLNCRTQCLYTLLLPSDLPIDYRDDMTVNVILSMDSFNFSKHLYLYISVDLKVSDILNRFVEIWKQRKKIQPSLRAIQVKDCRIVKKLSGDEPVSIFMNSILRIEFVPENSKETEKSIEINVCNAVISYSENNVFDFIGFPFLLRIGVDEPFEETRKKIAKAVKWNSEKVNHIRFYLGNENDPFDKDKVLKKGQKIGELIKVEKGDRLILIHPSEDAYRDDYSNRNSGVQINT